MTEKYKTEYFHQRCLQREARKEETTSKETQRMYWRFDFHNCGRNSCHLDQDVVVAGPSIENSPRIWTSVLETLRTTLKVEITSEIKSLLVESQKEMSSLLKPKTGEIVRVETGIDPENETRSFYTPKKSVRINSTRNNDPSTSRNMVTGVLNDSTNQQKRGKIRSQGQPASKDCPIVARTFASEKKRQNYAAYAKNSDSITPNFWREMSDNWTVWGPFP